jgi:hypothetical protein
MTFRLLLLALTSIGVCSACRSLPETEVARRRAADEYHAGRLMQAQADIALAIRREQDSDAEVDLEDLALGEGDTPLLILERGLVQLRAGDPAGAAAILGHIRGELRERRIDTLQEFIGFQEMGAGIEQLGRGDLYVPYAQADFEELTAYCFLMLAEALDGRQNLIAFASQFYNVQNELLESSYGVNDPDFKPGDVHRTLALGHYLEGVVREGQGNPDVAKQQYRSAAKLLEGNHLVAEALQRVEAGQPRSNAGEGVVHVVYLLGRGPRLEDSEFKLAKSDPSVEFAARLMLQVLEILNSMAKGESYTWEDALINSLTQLPIPVPIVVEYQQTLPNPSVSVDGSVSAASESFADYNEIARQHVEALRWMQVTRAVVRRFLKQTASQATVGKELGQLGGVLLQSLEMADTRMWACLPANVRIARVVLPHGLHSLDLGLGGPPTLVRVSFQDSFVLAYCREIGANATVLVDRFSAVDPEGIEAAAAGMREQPEDPASQGQVEAGTDGRPQQ